MGGNDFLSGGASNDRIDARDGAGFVDRVLCGDGQDTALVDGGDIVDPGCENVVGGAPATPPPVGNRAPTGIALSSASVAENRAGRARRSARSRRATRIPATRTPSRSCRARAPTTTAPSRSSARRCGRRRSSTTRPRARTRCASAPPTLGTPAGQIARSFTITVSDANEAPTALTLLDASVPENEPVGTDVGELSVSDVDAGQQHTFALVAGAGRRWQWVVQDHRVPAAHRAVLHFEAGPPTRCGCGRPTTARRPLSVESGSRSRSPTRWSRRPRRQVGVDREDRGGTVTLSASDPEGDDVTSFASRVRPATGRSVRSARSRAAAPEGLHGRRPVHSGRDFNGLAGFSYTASDGRQFAPGRCVDHGQPGQRRADRQRGEPLDDRGHAADAEPRRAGDRCRDRRCGPELRDRHAAGARHPDRATIVVGTRRPRLQRPRQLHLQGHRPRRPRQLRRSRSGLRRARDIDHRDRLDHGRPGQRRADRHAASRTTRRGHAADARPHRAGERSRDRRREPELRDRHQPAHGTGAGDDVHAGTPTTTAPTASPTWSPTAATPTTASIRPRCDAPELDHRTVSITVDPVNDAPVARREPHDRRGHAVVAGPGRLVSDVETADADLTYEIVTPPTHGTATATTYTPDADFNGTDSFTYRVTDRGDPDNCGTRDRAATPRTRPPRPSRSR